MSGGLTKAQSRALSAYARHPSDETPAAWGPPGSLSFNQIVIRSGIAPRHLVKTLEVLRREGLLVSGFTASDYRYDITDAGRQALSLANGDAS